MRAQSNAKKYQLPRNPIGCWVKYWLVIGGAHRFIKKYTVIYGGAGLYYTLYNTRSRVGRNRIILYCLLSSRLQYYQVVAAENTLLLTPIENFKSGKTMSSKEIGVNGLNGWKETNCVELKFS